MSKSLERTRRLTYARGHLKKKSEHTTWKKLATAKALQAKTPFSAGKAYTVISCAPNVIFMAGRTSTRSFDAGQSEIVWG